MADSKSFLHNWCAKQKINPPHFDVRPTGKIALATQRQPTETMKHIDLIIYKYLFNFFQASKIDRGFFVTFAWTASTMLLLGILPTKRMLR